MMLSPYYLIIAIGCFAGAALMFTRLRKESSVSIPTGVLLILAGIYILCGQFIKGFSENPTTSWAARGVLVVFLIYIVLSYNNMKAEEHAEFDQESENEQNAEETKEAENEQNN